MKNYDETVEINHDPNWSYIPDHPYRVLSNGGSGSGKTNAFLNLMKHQLPKFIYPCLLPSSPINKSICLLKVCFGT